MSVRKVRVIKQNNPLEKDQDYVRHRRSVIALLVPEEIEFTQQVIEKAVRQKSENLSCKPQLVVVNS